jgi:xylulokinase
MGVFLGLDSSTQSLSALAVDTDTREVVLSESVNFGKSLPEYASPQGFLELENPQRKHANPLMWVRALDLLFETVRAKGFDLGRVQGVSGAGQQHGSVYLRESLSNRRWSTGTPLEEQVKPLLSRATAPIWMDSSTSEECREIAASVGGDERVVAISGSRAIERFTGPQIRKFFKDEPARYEQTRQIHLVSSFIASLLVGESAGIDYGDGAGMNLLDLAAGAWSGPLLEATAPGLAERLPGLVACTTRVGTIDRYFVEKYGFAAGTPVIAFTGDNPSSLVGMGATEPGTAVISLGTSDTVFAAMREPRTDPRGFGHVFGNPAGGFMSLICFANGSLAREAVAKKFDLDWPAFDRALREETRPGNGGNLMLPFFVPEMTPKIKEPHVALFGDDAFTGWKSKAASVRAIVEAQALSMKRHSDWIGQSPETILVTGGASRNRGILQVIADVFQAEIRTLTVGNSSALGGALRAAHGAGGASFADLTRDFVAIDPDLRVTPDRSARGAYDDLAGRFAEKLASAGG